MPYLDRGRFLLDCLSQIRFQPLDPDQGSRDWGGRGADKRDRFGFAYLKRILPTRLIDSFGGVPGRLHLHSRPLLPAVMSVFPLVQTKTCNDRFSSHRHREGVFTRTYCEIFEKVYRQTEMYLFWDIL